MHLVAGGPGDAEDGREKWLIASVAEVEAAGGRVVRVPLVGGRSTTALVDRIRRGGEIVVHGDGTSLWTVTHSEDFAVGFCGLIGKMVKHSPGRLDKMLNLCLSGRKEISFGV